MAGSNKGIKVTDRRMFTPEGDVREDYQPEPEENGGEKSRKEPVLEEPAPEPPMEKSRPEPRSAPSDTSRAGDDSNAPPTLFMALTDNFIVSAYAAMGMVPGPGGERPPADPAAARQMIDLLEMLEEKTQGNLEPREATYLNTHLGELKLAFVRQNKSL